jgi:hypothetical protein
MPWQARHLMLRMTERDYGSQQNYSMDHRAVHPAVDCSTAALAESDVAAAGSSSHGVRPASWDARR